MEASARAYGDQASPQGYAAGGGARSEPRGFGVVGLFGSHEGCVETTPIEECCPDCQIEANLRRWTG